MQEPKIQRMSLSHALNDYLPFSESEITTWLFLGQKDDRSSSLKSASVPQGPGELLKWKAFNQDPDCFVSKIAVGGKPKKKILICNALLKDCPPKVGELALMSALVKYYDVYLWQKNDLSKAIPLTCGDDFWRLRETIQPATAAAMAQFFADQQMAADEWLVLDKSAYDQRWGKAPYHVDLTQVDLASEESRQILLESVDCAQIRCVNLFAPRPEVLQFTGQYFNNLKIIKFTDVSSAWLEKNIALLENSSVEIVELVKPVIPPSQGLYISLEKNYGIKKLVIRQLKDHDDNCPGIIKAEEPLSVYAEMDSLETRGKAVEEEAEPEYLVEEQLYKQAFLLKSSPMVINTVASYRKLIEKGENRTVTSLEINLEHLQKEYGEIFSNLANNFPCLQALLILSYKHEQVVNISHPTLESCVTRGTVQLIAKELPKLSNLEVSYISPLSQRLPALRRLQLWQLKSGQLPSLEGYAPSLEFLCIDQIELDIASIDFSTELVIGDSVKTVKVINEDQEFLPGICTMHGGKNLRSLSLIYSNTLRLELAKSQRLKKIHSTGWTDKARIIDSIDVIPDSLLLIDFHGNISQQCQQLLPSDCVVNMYNFAEEAAEEADEEGFEEEAKQATSERIPQRTYTFFEPEDELLPEPPDGQPRMVDLAETMDSGRLRYSIKALNDGEKTFLDRDYRIQVFNRIEIDDGNRITFRSNNSFLTVHDYQQFAQPWLTGMQRGRHTHKGQLTGNLKLEKNYPLAVNAPVAENQLALYVEFEPPAAQRYFKVGLYRDSSQDGYYVRLLPIDGAASMPLPAKVNLHYFFTPQRTYQKNKWSACTRLPEQKSAFTPKIQAEIAAVLQKLPKLRPIFNETLAVDKKLSVIVDYLTEFDSEKALLSSHPPGSLKLLFDIIQQRRGVCKDRAQAFMLLANFLGVETQLVINGVHAYCEIREVATKSWTRIDFGGGEVNYLGVIPPPELEPLAPLSIENPAEPFLRQYLSQTPVFSWSDFADPTAKPLPPVLITLPETADIKAIRREFFKPKQCGDSYLFIDGPADFRKYWQSYTLQADGSRQLMPGPLQHIFTSGGTLLINWTNFTSKQQLFYQSLWADLPRWEDQPISSRAVKIVGLLLATLTAPPSFTARCKLRRLPGAVAETKISVPAAEETSSSSSQAAISPPLISSPAPEPSIYHFDVFKSKSWQELLVADIEFSGKSSRLIEGFFYQVIAAAQQQKAACHLFIHQPPQDSDFDQFLTQIDLEKRYFFNGAFHRLPDNFLIFTTDTPLHSLPEKPPFMLLSQTPATARRHYLHVNNWHTLYQQIVVDSEGGLRSMAGRLRTESGKTTVFYVTQNIPDYEWQQLAYIIASKHPGQRFYFQLADGLSLPPGYSPPARIMPAPSQTLVTTAEKLPNYVKKVRSFYLTTNDPDYLVERLQQLCPSETEVLTIDLTPAMTVSDLLVSIRPNPAKGQELNFIVEKKFLFAALEAGKTVILKGQLSPRLQQELLPVFSKQPYLECNGQALPIKGRLLVVQPAATIPPLSLVVVCNFEPDDYAAALIVDKPEQKAPTVSAKKFAKKSTRTIEKLLQFFYLARIPHRGRSMPTDLGLSFTRLRQMKHLLLAPQHSSNHRHNRLKGLMLYDYDKGGEEYAFFNVLLKIFFDKNQEGRPLRHEKFQRLQQSIAASQGETRNFAWRLLNTCNGHMLRKSILGDWLISGLIENSPPPESLLPFWTKSDDWARVYKNLERAMRQFKKTPPSLAPAPVSSVLALAPPETKQIAKMQRRLAYLAQTKTRAKVVVIKGEPGVGKTHYLEQLTRNPEYSCTTGLDNIEQWLMDSRDHPRLLLLDEANTMAPGMLDLLDGIHRQPACIVYQGKSYRLSPQHKVFAAVNPEYFSGRYYHALLRKGETVLALLPDTAYLENYLVTTYGLGAEIAKALVAGAELFKRYQPLKGYSFRDLQNLVQRFQVLASQIPSAPQLLYAALYGEFAVAIADSSNKQQFDQELRQQLQLPVGVAQYKPFIIKHRMFPAEMQEAHMAIGQALDIRKQVLAKADDKTAPELLAYKRGVLLQGAAGVGKKLLCQQLLQEKGLVAVGGEALVIDPIKQYLEVTAGEASFRAVALKAFNLGAILVVNQLNFLSPDDERFLGGLLMGRYENSSAETPGFLVIATQNPNGELGGGALSPALCNRMQILSLPRYADNSWELLAKQKLSSEYEAQQFTQAFWHPKTPYPTVLTGHDFFSCLEKEATRLASLRSRSKRELSEELIAAAPIKKNKAAPPAASPLVKDKFSPRLFALPSPPVMQRSVELSPDQLVASFFASHSSSLDESSLSPPRQGKRKRMEEVATNGLGLSAKSNL